LSSEGQSDRVLLGKGSANFVLTTAKCHRLKFVGGPDSGADTFVGKWRRSHGATKLDKEIPNTSVSRHRRGIKH
jgi:hypothetical protein